MAGRPRLKTSRPRRHCVRRSPFMAVGELSCCREKLWDFRSFPMQLLLVGTEKARSPASQDVCTEYKPETN